MTRTQPRGFSLVELLVVIGVFALLLSLLLPAVLAARGAARATWCKGRLRDLAVASHHYHDTHGMLPAYVQPGGAATAYFSVQAQLLPFIGEAMIYEGLNFTAGYKVPNVFGTARSPEHATAAATRVAAFLCPDDPMPFLGGCNYRTNFGTGPMHWRSIEHPDSGNGVFCDWPPYPRKLRDVIDGLSKTAMFSERVAGSDDAAAPWDDLRDVNDLVAKWEDFQLADAVFGICSATARLPPRSVGSYPYAGKYWIAANLLHGWYNHAAPPNCGFRDCQMIGDVGTPGLATARSYHAGGVHVARCDTSTTFVAESISLAVWRALATRDGMEGFADDGW